VQAHVAPVGSAAEVDAVLAALLRSSKVARATHNMLAYRIAVPGQQGLLQDYDDDGEAAAGGRLLHLLQARRRRFP
jgi:putative IMPACT (imprinted ancient) family translation regulator